MLYGDDERIYKAEEKGLNHNPYLAHNKNVVHKRRIARKFPKTHRGS